jgi:hypothetical protein
MFGQFVFCEEVFPLLSFLRLFGLLRVQGIFLSKNATLIFVKEKLSAFQKALVYPLEIHVNCSRNL